MVSSPLRPRGRPAVARKNEFLGGVVGGGDRLAGRRQAEAITEAVDGVNATHRNTSAQTTAPNSLPRRSGTGSQPSVRRQRLSSQARLGRTATARASTPGCATSCSTTRSSTASRKPGSSSKAGASTTTPSVRTRLWDIDRQRQTPSSGPLQTPGQLHRQRQTWPQRRSCTNIKPGPPNGSRPSGPSIPTTSGHTTSSRIGPITDGSIGCSTSSMSSLGNASPSG